ncbi:MAG: hypothetical protein U5M50_04060 [Sphingobium sp.]|nr:hypothetical protein [Sphingobium sp.]
MTQSRPPQDGPGIVNAMRARAARMRTMARDAAIAEAMTYAAQQFEVFADMIEQGLISSEGEEA